MENQRSDWMEKWLTEQRENWYRKIISIGIWNDLSFVREFVQETYAAKGHPSVDPVVFFKLQLVMAIYSRISSPTNRVKVSSLSPNIVGHIPNGNAQIIDPPDPCNGLHPFVTNCCSDF